MQIEWQWMAKPREDGYDTQVLIALQEAQFGPRPRIQSRQRLGGGRIAVTEDPYNGDVPRFHNAREHCTDARLGIIDDYLVCWPAGWTALDYLTDFWPKFTPPEPGNHPDTAWMMKGCSSGHHIVSAEHPYTSVIVTINDGQGCAEGIYHEMGHLRLRQMGVAMEDHDGKLFHNRPDELYDSPVRFDVKRPMSAVLHGLYSWLMFTENDLHCARKKSAADSAIFLAMNIPKIENGCREVQQHIRPTAAGIKFLDGMMTWASDIVAEGRSILKAVHGEYYDSLVIAQHWPTRV